MSIDTSEKPQKECSDPWMPEVTLAGDFTMNAGALVGPRTLDAYELIYFPAGSATAYSVSGDTYVLDRSGVTITRPGEYHQCLFDPAQYVRHLFAVFYFPCEEGQTWFESFLHRHIWIRIDPHSQVPTLFKHLLQFSGAKGPNWKLRPSKAFPLG